MPRSLRCDRLGRLPASTPGGAAPGRARERGDRTSWRWGEPPCGLTAPAAVPRRSPPPGWPARRTVRPLWLADPVVDPCWCRCPKREVSVDTMLRSSASVATEPESCVPASGHVGDEASPHRRTAAAVPRGRPPRDERRRFRPDRRSDPCTNPTKGSPRATSTAQLVVHFETIGKDGAAPACSTSEPSPGRPKPTPTDP